MRELRCAPALPESRGERLGREAYRADFRERRGATRDRDSWKLERLQHFEEVGDASRDALRKGDWPEALRLFEADRAGARASALREQRHGAFLHRVRVVEEPLSPYVQWELHWLRLSAECGHRVRVLPASALAAAESAGPLPELTLLAGHTLYRVLYTPAGVPDGALRWTDPAVVLPWAAYLSEAYAAGEDVRPYFERAVAPLPPPAAA